jgi:hypothetical protein
MKRFLVYLLLAITITACGCPEPAQAAQSAQSIQFLLSQVRNTSGPLAGGKVWAYAAGTSTAKTIWLNRSKATVAANPYTLDANGTAALFGDGLYRIVIKTAAGVTVYDRDNLSFRDASGYVYNVTEYASLAAAVAAIGSTPATLEYSTDQTLTANLSIPATLELAPLNGAKIIHGAYTIGGAGMANTARWHQGQMFSGTGAITGLTGTVIPQWWGAKGDGTTVDSAAINKAMLAAKTVYLPNTGASYIIDGADPLALRSGSNLYSHGATLKLKPGTYATLAEVITSAPGQDGSWDEDVPVVSDVSVSGIKIDGNMANVTGSATGIDLYKVLRAKVTDVTIKDLPGTTGAGYGIIAEYSDSVWITRPIIDRTDRQNIAIWETQDAHIDGANLNFSYLRDCILVADLQSATTAVSYQTSYATITNSKLTNTSATGTHVVRFSGGGSGSITDCEIRSNDNLQGVYVVDTVTSAQSVHIARNKIYDCSKGIEVDTKAARLISIDDNDIVTSVNGIRYEGAELGVVKVTNNEVIGTTTQPLNIIAAKDKIVSGNIFDGGSSAVIVEAFTTGSTIVSDNIIRNLTSASYSLLVTGDATAKPLITGNVLENNTANTINSTIAAVVINNPGATVAGSLIHLNAFNGIRQVYSAAIPTSGTWNVNDRVIRQSATVGQPKAWVIAVNAGVSGAGTAGTLNGGATTADTTATSDVIAVSSTTGLNVGDYITVAGIGGTTKKKVVSISGLNVTVDTAATNTVNDGAVSFVAPTFTSEGNL